MGDTGKHHYLKTWPEYFQAMKDGTKTFEMRKNDRKYTVGDTLILQEFNPETELYTDSVDLWFRVTYVLDKQPFVSEGYVCMATKPIWGMMECRFK